MNRRSFLTQSSALISWSLLSKFGALLPLRALGHTESPSTNMEDHFFLLLLAVGGWDVTLGLDPKTHDEDQTDQQDIFIEYRPDEILHAGNLKLGPAAYPLKNHYADLLIVNGVDMRRDAGHAACLDIIASGNGNGVTPLLPVEIGATTTTGPKGILTNTVVQSGSRNVILTDTRSLFEAETYTDDLLRIMRHMNYTRASSFDQAALGLLEAQSLMPKFYELMEQHEMAHGYLDPNLDLSPAIAYAFAAGLSRQAVYHLNLGSFSLDTHSSHERTHLENQRQIWEHVSNIFSLFKSIEYKGKSLFDQTTFMVVSEFSRTPYLNNGNGKDHNPSTNSVLLAGKGVRGNSVIGASRVHRRDQTKTGMAEHVATALDFKTGALVRDRKTSHPDVQIIFPENVARTVAKIFGDPKEFSAVSLDDVRPLPSAVTT